MNRFERAATWVLILVSFPLFVLYHGTREYIDAVGRFRRNEL